MNLRKFAKYWLPAIFWIALVLAASSGLMSAEHTSRFLVPFLRWLSPEISAENIATVQFFIRKMAHLFEYAVLSALLLRAIRAGTWPLAWPHVFIAVAVAAVCAASDEFHQSLVATRTGSPSDVMIDIVGAMIGSALYWWFTQRRSDAGTAPAQALIDRSGR